ncbi:hypothetical protein [Ralstonia syzygii]|uniref:hypothetical protein n=1 Tax=Ralstonia syzygii TaxID=28097 RepID=UPI0018D0C9D7|nr:hypothetical protein [Ralstonia syzygii]CAH0447688.1 hypothetical protein LMG10661_03758 [Ralstonia syzygii subsp. syzygii]
MSIRTSLSNATRIHVEPVRFLRTIAGDSVFATQSISVTLDDGNRFDLLVYLTEGMTCLAAGDAVVFPTLDEVPA